MDNQQGIPVFYSAEAEPEPEPEISCFDLSYSLYYSVYITHKAS